MFAIIGLVVVFGCILGGYLFEKGNILVLLQPAELLIIGGSALGTVLMANPPAVLKKIVASMLLVIKGSRYTAGFYLDTLKFLSDFFTTARKNGIASLETDFDDPAKSALFKRHPAFVSNTYALNFFCDTLRTVATGGVGVHEMDQVMETDLEVLDKQGRLPVNALSTMADSLPGLGIVAAVLGIVITMGALGGPPEEIGKKVAGALVGTFLGILLCYGLFGPLAANIGRMADAEAEYFQCLRMGILAFMQGAPNILALEAARRAIPHHLRPTFQEMDKSCRKVGVAPAQEAAA
jgi:chemotaxis protein MotA